MECPSCGSRDIEIHDSSGDAICVSCGTVLEENAIVSSVEFQESGDRSTVIGQFVASNCSKPYSASARSRGRYGLGRESREATLANARRVISQVVSTLRLPSHFIDQAGRLYKLALERNFVYGRRQVNVVATCLYIICRREKSPHLLIDFSDALQVNVYNLGKCYLNFRRLLSLDVPIIDPSLYIHRYASALELDDKLNAVTMTALRIVARMKRDWMNTGRRPDGICAAAMLIATRSHGFDRGQLEIAKLFRVASDTLKKRLEEFRRTPAAQLTIEQFHLTEFALEFDPPAFITNQVKQGAAAWTLPPGEGDEQDPSQASASGDFKTDNDGTVRQHAVINGVEMYLPAPGSRKNRKSSKKLQERQLAAQAMYKDIYSQLQGDHASLEFSLEAQDVEADVQHLNNRQRLVEEKFELNIELVDGDNVEIALPPEPKSENGGADDDDDENGRGSDLPQLSFGDIRELDALICTDEETAKRKAVWQEMHKDYLQEQEKRQKEKEAAEAADAADTAAGLAQQKAHAASGKARKRKPYNRLGVKATAEEALQHTLQAKRMSKKINYKALENVFGAPSTSVKGADVAEESAHDALAGLAGEEELAATSIHIGSSLGGFQPAKRARTTTPAVPVTTKAATSTTTTTGAATAANKQNQAEPEEEEEVSEEEEVDQEGLVYDEGNYGGDDYADEFGFEEYD